MDEQQRQAMRRQAVRLAAIVKRDTFQRLGMSAGQAASSFRSLRRAYDRSNRV
jgi:hypothetical protein